MVCRIVHLSDLHLDAHPGNLKAAIALLRDVPAELALVGGDNGGDAGIRATVDALRERYPAVPIAWVKGNHDLWGREYTSIWDDCPRLDAVHLETANLELADCTVVGTYGHYDYRAGLSSIALEQYESFSDGRVVWNDRYIQRLGMTNPAIAAALAERFFERYRAAIERGLPIVVLTHTVPFGPTDDRMRSFITAYLANVAIGDFLQAVDTRPAVVFCGHTHRPMRWEVGGMPVINVGSDYKQVRIATFELQSR